MITLEALRAVGATAARAAEVLEPLKAACAIYGIDTPVRLAAFLAQVGHESGGFRYASEIWGPTAAQKRYEGRADLGNTQPGDGERFKGHGFIQTTGRFNHAKVRDRLRERFDAVPDFEVEPERLAEMQWACLSAADYWDMRAINALADAGDFEAVTRAINGGLNGLADRRDRWERVKTVLGAPATETLQGFAATDTIPQETTMGPFVPIAIEALASIVPKIGEIFAGESPIAQRNVKATSILLDAAKDAVGARNEQELVETIQSDPSATAAIKDAVAGVWWQLTEVGGGIQAARQANEKAQGDRPFWFNPAFWLSILLMAMPFMLLVDLFFVHPDKYEDNLRTQIVTGVLMVITLIGGYWFGTSAGSQRKTDMLTGTNR